MLGTDAGTQVLGDGGTEGQDGTIGSGQSVENSEDGGMACGSLSVSAQAAMRPVDIVWVIDSSPSMRDEIERVQSNLNTFAQRIGTSGLD